MKVLIIQNENIEKLYFYANNHPEKVPHTIEMFTFNQERHLQSKLITTVSFLWYVEKLGIELKTNVFDKYLDSCRLLHQELTNLPFDFFSSTNKKLSQYQKQYDYLDYILKEAFPKEQLMIYKDLIGNDFDILFTLSEQIPSPPQGQIMNFFESQSKKIIIGVLGYIDFENSLYVFDKYWLRKGVESTLLKMIYPFQEAIEDFKINSQSTNLKIEFFANYYKSLIWCIQILFFGEDSRENDSFLLAEKNGLSEISEVRELISNSNITLKIENNTLRNISKMVINNYKQK